MKKILDFLKNMFKKNFIAGTLVLLPIITTIWILKSLTLWADTFIISILPNRFHPDTIFNMKIPGLGIIVTVLLVLFAGLFTRLYIGKKLVSLGDKIFSKIPIGRSIYTVIKEFLTGVLGDDKNRFKSVALIEWPRKGCYMLAFVTGNIKPLIETDSQKWITLFVPTSPNPTSGYLIMLPENEVKILEIRTDEAFKTIISGGISSSKIK